jgi:hypothetical protein
MGFAIEEAGFVLGHEVAAIPVGASLLAMNDYAVSQA